MKMIQVAAFADEFLAQVFASQLEMEGIDSLIDIGDAGGLYPSMSLVTNVRVLVDEQHLSAATACYEAFQARQQLADDEVIDQDDYT